MYNVVAIETMNRFNRTDSGKSWKSKPFKTEKKALTWDSYCNATDEGWKRILNARYKRGYHSQGYLIDTVTYTNPTDTERVVCEYTFTRVDTYRNAGWRERWIVEHAYMVELSPNDNTLKFYAKDPDDCNASRTALWSLDTDSWVG